MQRYLVIGVREENLFERYADHHECNDHEQAEVMARAYAPDLIVAAVINEEGQIVA